jgi:hypothetical protein
VADMCLVEFRDAECTVALSTQYVRKRRCRLNRVKRPFISQPRDKEGTESQWYGAFPHLNNVFYHRLESICIPALHRLHFSLCWNYS